ncbi:host-nuclease inhibitor protein gam [Escherichia coli H383]|nr:host-nuclease inhibitor protein gam [Escherichia coli H383]
MRLRAGRVTTSRSPVKRKRQNWQTTWKKACPSTCLNRYVSIICNATGPAKKPLKSLD